VPDHQRLQIADPRSQPQRSAAPLTTTIHSGLVQEQRGVADSPRPSHRSVLDIERFSGDPNFMSSLARGIIVMRRLREHKRLTARELAQKTGLSIGSVGRCLYTLHHLGITSRLDRHWCFSDHFRVASPGPVDDPTPCKGHEFGRVAEVGQEMRDQRLHTEAVRVKARPA
jgi:hypothetical protein